MTKRIAILVVFARLGFGQPALPRYDWGACPYETCGYHQWTVHRAVTVYDTWKEGRRAVGHLGEGEKVTGLRGVVITLKPGVIRMDRDLPDLNLHQGDTILTYGGSSEGFTSVWFKSKFHSSFDISFAKLPDGSGCGNGHCAATYVESARVVWWAEVRWGSGSTGWVDMELGKMPVAAY